MPWGVDSRHARRVLTRVPPLWCQGAITSGWVVSGPEKPLAVFVIRLGGNLAKARPGGSRAAEGPPRASRGALAGGRAAALSGGVGGQVVAGAVTPLLCASALGWRAVCYTVRTPPALPRAGADGPPPGRAILSFRCAITACHFI